MFEKIKHNKYIFMRDKRCSQGVYNDNLFDNLQIV